MDKKKYSDFDLGSWRLSDDKLKDSRKSSSNSSRDSALSTEFFLPSKEKGASKYQHTSNRTGSLTTRDGVTSKLEAKSSRDEAERELCSGFADESSAFINKLGISELEKDELFCQENFSYLPVPKHDFSVTTVDYSKVNNPNFMPVDDSLFSHLSTTTSEPFKDVTSVDSNFYSKVDSSVLGGVPSIEDISLVLRKSDNDTNPLELMKEVLRVGDKFQSKPFSNNQPTSKEDKHLLVLEEEISFPSVFIGDEVTHPVHLVNKLSVSQIVKVSIKGNKEFILKNISSDSFTATPGISKLQVSFAPEIVGPATAILNIVGENCSLKLKICGFGGKPLVAINGINSYLDCTKPNHLITKEDFSFQVILQNDGNASSFYYVQHGLQTILSVRPQSGLVSPGKRVEVTISLNKGYHSLSYLLNSTICPVTGPVIDIGQISLHIGEESARQRLKRLCRIHDNNAMIAQLRRNHPYVLEEFSEKQLDLTNFCDSVKLEYTLANEFICKSLTLFILKTIVEKSLKAYF